MLMVRQHACVMLLCGDIKQEAYAHQCKQDLSTQPRSISDAITQKATLFWGLPLRLWLVLTITYVASTILLFFGRLSQIYKHGNAAHTN